MIKYSTLISLIIYFFSLISCQPQGDQSNTYIQLHRNSYIDDLIVEASVEAVNSSTVVCPQRLEGTVIFLVENGTFVKQGDTVCVLENREYTDYYESLILKVEQSKASFNHGKADLEMNMALLMAQVRSNEAQAAISSLDSAQLMYLSPQQQKVKGIELQITSIEKEKYEKKLDFLKQINESELKKLELKIMQDQNQADHIKEIIDGMVMLAPRDGLAMRAKPRYFQNQVQEGDLVWEGVALVEIPDLTQVKTTIQASEASYKRIKEGDSIVYTFDAMPGNIAWGKVERKAPMGQPVSRGSKVRNFEISASIDSFKVLPDVGISAQCRVFLSYVPDTIVVPQLAVFDTDSIKVVYVRKGNKNFEKRQVVLGNSSPSNAIVAVGLSGSEQIMLVKPKNKQIKSETLLPDSIAHKYGNGNWAITNDYAPTRNIENEQSDDFETIIIIQ